MILHHHLWLDLSVSSPADRGARFTGEEPPACVATICIGGVEEYCPYKDWSIQMSLSSFPKQLLKADFSTLCLAECV